MAIPNDEYWARRMEITNNALLDRGFAYTQNLDEQFNRAIAGVEKDMAAWYQRFASNNGISYAEAQKWLTKSELKEFRWSVEEFIKKAEESALNGRWIKELENASARVHISRLDALKLQLQQRAELLHGGQLDGLDAHLRRTYLDRYYTTAFEIQKGIGTGWTVHDLGTGVVDRVLARPWTADMQTFRDRVWTNKQALVSTVNTHLTQMIIRGEAPQKTIAALAHDMGVSKAKAGRLVMTESAYFSAAAQKDCFNGLGVEEYVIVATLDSSTSEVCRDMDGKVFKMSDYTEGLTAPPFHPWCRSVTAPYFADMQGLGQRARRDPDTGNTVVDVPRSMTYRDWREKFVDGSVRNSAMQDMNIEPIQITAESINRVKTFDCDTIPKQLQEKLKNEHKKLLITAAGKPLGTEAGATYDLQMNLLHKVIGQDGRAKIQMPVETVPYIAVHNHPTGGTFTHKDLFQFAKTTNMRMLTAIGNNGTVYAAEKTSEFAFDDFMAHWENMKCKHPCALSDLVLYAAYMKDLMKGADQYGVRIITTKA